MFFVIFAFLIDSSIGSVDEYRLLQYLKENYDYFERPVPNSTEPLDVKVRFLLNQILDVDEKNQVMHILAYIDYHWTDYKMSWDPKKFGGITDVRFHGGDDAPFRLWRPDILLFNSVSESFDSTYASRFIVNYDGHVQQNPPGIFRFICKVDMTYYPFDAQTCFLKLGSWTYSGNYINLDFIITDMVGVSGHTVTATKVDDIANPGSYSVNESIDMQVFLKNGEWDLTSTPGKRVVTVFDGNAYHELYYYINIRRMTLAYGINLIIPSLVISMMTVLGFTLPPEAGEKLTLQTTVLLSVIFFLQMVSDMSPPQSQCVPILAAFFCSCLLVVSCSCVFTVLVLSMYNRKPETHEMGPWMRKVFIEWLPYILLMRRPNHPRAPKPKVINKTIAPVHRLSTMVPMLKLPRPSTTAVSLFSTTNTSPYLKYFEQFVRGLQDVEKDLEAMARKVQKTYKHEIEVSEWRFAAMAVDRLCLYLFTLFITVSTCGIIVPHIFKAAQLQLR